jgi:hypothetical protein
VKPLEWTFLEYYYLKWILQFDFLGFLRLVAPYLLTDFPDDDELDVTFLDQEFWNFNSGVLWADGIIGIRRRSRRKKGYDLPIVHLELEHAYSSRLGERLAPCHRAIARRHESEILTVAVVLRGDRSGFVIEEEPFRWLRFALPGCDAEEYLARDEPVAWAFAARMNPGAWSPERLQRECLQRLDRAPGLDGRLHAFLEGWFEEGIGVAAIAAP